MKAIRAIIWKELRENAKWAVLAALGFVLLCVYKAQRTDFGNDADLMKSMLSWTTVGAPFVGFGLGLLQIVPELRRDRWAFLLHRPVPRSTIFFGKACAGVCLYLAAIAVPFAGVAVWLSVPGHMAAPFVPRLVLPGIADILAGLIFYFAAMLTALRPARWYGSRILGLITALFAFGMVVAIPEFWPSLGVAVISICAMMAAAWGSFVASGDYGAQPRLARSMLGTVLFAGIFPILVIGMSAIEMQMTYQHFPSREYQIDKDGHIIVLTYNHGNVPDIQDLQGRPLPTPTGPFDAVFMTFPQLSPLIEWRSVNRDYHSGGYQFTPVDEGGKDVRWYYDAANPSRLYGYSLHNRQFIGSLGPDGFTGTMAGPTFISWMNEVNNANSYMIHGRLLRSSDTLYVVNIYRRTVTPIATVPTPERIRGTNIQSVPTKSNPSNGVILFATQRYIRGITPEGKALFSTPVAFDLDRYHDLRVAKLAVKDNYFFWYSEGGAMPYVVETDGNGHEISRNAAPDLRRYMGENAKETIGYGIVAPLALLTAFYGATSVQRHFGMVDTAFWWLVTHQLLLTRTIAISAAAGLIASLFAYFIGLRYGWDRKGRLSWAFGIFWLGIPGLLMLLSLDRWPAWETCSVCGKKRVVTRELCEYCGAAWPAPGRNGTEIFDQAAA